MIGSRHLHHATHTQVFNKMPIITTSELSGLRPNDDNATTPTTLAYERQLTETITATTSWTRKIQWGTRILATLQLVLYFVSLFPIDLVGNTCLPSPDSLRLKELPRLLTHAFSHAGLLHVLFNLIAFVSLGSIVEKRIGTINMMFWTVTLLAVLTGILSQVLQALFILIKLILEQPSTSSCAVGMSAVIFTFIIAADDLKCPCTSGQIAESRPFCGINIPTHLYPWILLLTIQLLFPGASFFGHLAGILVGYVFSSRTRWFTLPLPVASKLESLLPESIRSNTFAFTSAQDVFGASELPSHRPVAISVTEPSQPFPGSGQRLGQ